MQGITRMSSNGQIFIPTKLQKLWKLKPGTILTVVLRGKTITLKPYKG